jgi:glycosyltransferase involved in cell wall biosynthesis
VRVLYVNHTAQVSGGERSLLSLLAALPAEIEPCLATPPGRLAELARELGVPVTGIAGTAGSLRLHPLHTPRALAQMSVAALQVRAAAGRHRAQIVHANSIRAGILLALPRPRSTATVVHVRDCLPPGRVSGATLRLIAARADTVLANSAYTADRVRQAAPAASLEVAHNPVDLDRFDPDAIDRAAARAALGEAGRRALLIGVVAQLTPWKGQDVAIEALRLLREQGVDAHLLLVGSAKFVEAATRFDNRRYVEGLKAQVADAGLSDRVSFLGEREDVPQLVRALDALLLPSWEEPFGRAAIEAMALEVPVLATNVGGTTEVIVEGRHGHLLDPRDPAAWARALAELAADPERAARMGRAGGQRAREAFGVAEHVRRVREVYAVAAERRAADHARARRRLS